MWMCDRCQSINDDAREVCPQCGASHAAPGAVVPRAAAPGVVTPQFSQPFGGEAPAAQPGFAPPVMPPVSFGAPPSSLGPQYQSPVAPEVPAQYPPPVTPGGPSQYQPPSTMDGSYSAPVGSNTGGGNSAVAAGVGAILLIGLGSLLLRLLNPIRLFFIAVGVGCIIGGNYLSHRRQAFMAHAVHVTGIVSSLREEHSGDSIMYYPVVQFTAAGGVPIIINSAEGSKPPQFHVGESCQVYYNPLDPHDAIVDSPTSRWISVFLWGFGVLVILCALFGKQTAGG